MYVYWWRGGSKWKIVYVMMKDFSWIRLEDLFSVIVERLREGSNVN